MEKCGVKKSCVLALMCVFMAAPAAAENAAAPAATSSKAPAVVATVGQMLHASNGGRLAPVNRVTTDGSVQIIINGKIVTVPISTLSMPNGELTTSLSKNKVLSLP